MGLNKAIDKFDPSYDNRFASYAYKCIMGYILNAINDFKVVKHSNVNNIYIDDILPHSLPQFYQSKYIESFGLDMDRSVLFNYIESYLNNDEYKFIFIGHYFKGRTSNEIGADIGLTKRQVLYRLNKINLVLKEIGANDGGYLKGLLKGLLIGANDANEA